MDKPKILIIRFRQLGDAVLSSTLCTSIRKSIPNAEIHYVLNEHIAPAFEGHPDIDKLIVFGEAENKSFLKYVFKIWKLVRKEKYTVIIDIRATTRTILFSLFSLKSKYRIGRVKSYNRLIHNYRISNFPDGTEDTVTLTLRLLDPLKKMFNVCKDPAFYLRIADKDKQLFRDKMIEKGIDFSKPIILCNVVTKLSFKCWDKDKMKSVVERILDKYENVQLIFNFGGDEEREAAQKLYEAIKLNNRIFIDIEADNTKDLVAMVANCDFYFGNEGGTRHIAQALDIPSFAIYAPNARKKIWLPSTSPRYQGIEAEDVDPVSIENKELTHEQKFALIDIDSVWEKLDEMLVDTLQSKE